MGKHEKKAKKRKKHKKEKRRNSSSESSTEDEWVEKKHKKEKRRNNSSESSMEDEWVEKKHKKEKRRNSSSESSIEDEWVEKKHKQEKRRNNASESAIEDEWVEKKHKKRNKNSSESSIEDEWVEKEPVPKKVEHERLVDNNRDEWMSLSSSFPTTSHAGRRKEREEAKLKEKIANTYDPRTCPRELNPYWKQGGDGLPSQSLKFQKPSEDSNYSSSYKPKRSQSSWRKNSTQGSPDRRNSFRKKEERRFEDKREDSKYPYKKEEEYKHEDKKYSHEEEQEDRKRSKSPANTFVETKSGLVFHNLDVETEEKVESTDYLTDKEMNEIGAKIIKAEILGNASKVKELKEKLERAQVCRKNKPETEETVILTKTDAKGFSRPLDAPETEVSSKRKNKRIETHQAGLREKYFPDDGKYSLQQMFENEKFNTHDQDAEFVKLSAKAGKMDDMDDIFMDKIRNEKNPEKKAKGERDRAIQEHKRMSETLDNCQQCIQSASMPKHLLVTLGQTVYISLPQHEPLTEGHCLITPTRHVSCSTQLDENEWSEITEFRKSLTNMFISQDQDVVFYETVLNSQSYAHMVIHCVPLPKEQGDLAPIYFKKAIDECETEWMTNKKLVNLAGKDVRRAIPKGLPYFFVSFGMTEGFAHVIEDERYFPRNFAAEIIGGILDLHHSKWRNPRREKFDLQKSRVLEFSNMWKQFDCTNK